MNWISLLSTTVCFSSLLDPLQPVWVHVCHRAICANPLCLTTEYLLRWFNGAFLNFWEQYPVFSHLQLILKNHWSHTFQWITRRTRTYKICILTSDGIWFESDVRGRHGHIVTHSGYVKAVFAFTRQWSVREIKLLSLCAAEVRFA